MTLKNRPIGVFDSGVGGLSVLKELFKIFPNENFKYLGDTARMPYGIKTPQEIRDFTYECLNYLTQNEIKAAIIACNTATCYGLENAQKNLSIPIIGVVEPACAYASSVSKNKKIGLIATDGTVKSMVYNNTIAKFDDTIELRGIGAPDLVLDIESGNLNNERVKNTIKKYLDKLDFNYDTLILGCTHFPLAMSSFEEIFKEDNREVNLIDPANKTALELKSILSSQDLLNDAASPKVDFLATGNVDLFKDVVLNVIDKDIYKNFYKITL